MFEKCIPPESLALLKVLVANGIMRDYGFYLAGGTGLALQIGHRISEDLDFFTERPFQPQKLADRLAGNTEAKIVGMATGTLHALLQDKVRVSFLQYPYKLLFPPKEFWGCPVADCRDIGAAKIIAVGQRGARKDFVDLYYLAKAVPWAELKDAVDRKYVDARYSWVHLARGLGYFEEAEQDPMPVMLTSGRPKKLTATEWEAIKGFFRQLQKELLLEVCKNK